VGKKQQIEYFEGLLDKHGENYLALDWNSPESQRLRYDILQEILIYGRKSAKISVLDLGCGFGDLYDFFEKEGLIDRHKINYLGYDIAPKILDAAKRKHPQAKFELVDVLENREVPQFDYVFSSGVLNIRTMDLESHMGYAKSMLQRMCELAKIGVAVNFLSQGALSITKAEDLNSGRYYYFNPEEMLRFCGSICSRYILRHDYHPGDFTVYLLK